MKTEQRPVFVDIDGTLTTTPGRPWGPVLEDRLEAVRALVRGGNAVVLWTGGGTDYARAFAREHGLDGVTCVGKPSMCVDDNPDLSPSMQVVNPACLD